MEVNNDVKGMEQETFSKDIVAICNSLMLQLYWGDKNWKAKVVTF